MGWSTFGFLFLQAKKKVNASGFSLGCLGLDSPKFFCLIFFMILQAHTPSYMPSCCCTVVKGSYCKFCMSVISQPTVVAQHSSKVISD